MSKKLTVLGGGSWGTALAQVQARLGQTVTIWDRDTERLYEMKKTRRNQKYHPDFELEPSIQLEPDMEKAIGIADTVIFALPSHTFDHLAEKIGSCMQNDSLLISASKGIDINTLETISDTARRIWGETNVRERFAVLSGPSFAKEVMLGNPTAVTLASESKRALKEIQRHCHGPSFLLFSSDDVRGVELAGALKNVMAIAAGASDGFGFGLNARAALITRGIVEATRIGKKLGAHPATFAGLSGVGDLILTCTGDLSRNRRVGLELAKEQSLKEVMKKVGQIAEGIRTTKAAYQLVQKHKVEAPIIETIYQTLYEGIDPQTAIRELLSQKPAVERA